MGDRPRVLAGVVWGCAAALPVAAQTASMTVTHDDPDGVLAPGETARITFTGNWQNVPYTILGRAVGDAVTTPNLGTATNAGSDFIPGPLVMLGSVSGASVVGIELYHVPPWATTIVVPPFTSGGARLTWFDWTAPQTPGEYRFDFVPDPNVPLFELWPHTGTPLLPTPVPTTYTGTSLRVIPAPGGVVVLGVCGLALATRRRRR